MTLSIKEYVGKKGIVCPNCEKATVATSDSGEFSDGGGMQNCYCKSCHAEWTDIYTLECYSNLELPTKESKLSL
jgi:hypothetical protein